MISVSLVLSVATACVSPDINVSDYYPNFSILGFAKCGTSHLHSLIKSHPMVQQAGRTKETCFHGGIVGQLNRKSPAHPYSVNSCLKRFDQLRTHRCLWPRLTFKPKYIFSLRPPADYLWARYNFWTVDLDVRWHSPGRWTNLENYRSPEMFHELVLAGDKIRLDSRPTMPHYAAGIVRPWILELEKTQAAVGMANLLIINIDEIQTDQTDPGFQKRLCEFLGLSLDLTLSNIRTNSGAYLRGRGASNAGIQSNGRYEVSGWRPMLNATRVLINTREKQACAELRARFNTTLCN